MRPCRHRAICELTGGQKFQSKQSLFLMAKSIVGIARSNLQVERTIDELQEDALIPVSEISVVMPEAVASQRSVPKKRLKLQKGPVPARLLAASLEAPRFARWYWEHLPSLGFGPLIAAGPIMAALGGTAAGATAGGLVGALVGFGIPESEARVYEERLKEGGYSWPFRLKITRSAEISPGDHEEK